MAAGLSSSACSTGRAKQPVLPLPVCARPMMSLPVVACDDDGWPPLHRRTLEGVRHGLCLDCGRLLPA